MYIITMRNHAIPSLLQIVNIIPKIKCISLYGVYNFQIDVLQFPHKLYLQKGYFFCVYVVAKKKLLVIRIFLNKQQNFT